MYLHVCMFLTKIKFIIRAARRSLFTKTMIKNRRPFKRKNIFSSGNETVTNQKTKKGKTNLTVINLRTGVVIQSHFRVTCVGILLCPRGQTSARFCTFLLTLTWMLVCFSVVGQKFIVQWSNILLHENPQGKSVML